MQEAKETSTLLVKNYHMIGKEMSTLLVKNYHMISKETSTLLDKMTLYTSNPRERLLSLIDTNL